MKKLKALINKKRVHFYNRVNKRKGKLKWILYFILSRQVESRYENTQVYQYKKIIFFVTDNELQTYIDKRISRKDEKLAK